MDRELIRKISEKIYSLFVVNTAAAGIQQKNGAYIRKYVRVSPFLIEGMIVSGGSMGCYQQGYKTGYIKWICLDFDCKDKTNPDLQSLYNEVIYPITNYLDNIDIHYLTEFSGRRGIHIWIIFDHILKKSLGFRILKEILHRVSLDIADENAFWNLDKFPSTDSSKGNTVGKQVKFPLSTHRAGGMAYFFEGNYEIRFDLGSTSFFQNQYEILSHYQLNNVEAVMNILGLHEEYQKDYSYKYIKYKVFDAIDIKLDDLWNIIRETRAFSNIYDRMCRGQARPEDWIVLLGTLSPCDKDCELVHAVLREFPNYDENKTSNNVKKLRDRYFPASFGYLYNLYDLEMEEGLDPDMTGLDYLCKRLDISAPEVQDQDGGKLFPNGRKLRLKDTINKEKEYLLYNDESPDIYIWNQLCLMRYLDELDCQKSVDEALATGVFSGEIEPFRVYERIESEEKIRKLVSLSARDRVVTTHLALEFYKDYKKRWKSFSYRPSLLSRYDIFYAWYRSWANYIEAINTYIEVPFFEEYQVVFIDLKKFYDHVDFLTVYNTIQEEISEEASKILRYLISYNDSLMVQINNGNRIGVPQGPAYARIIAEVFLDIIISRIEDSYGENVIILRYVDDITIICNPGFDSELFFKEFCNTMAEYGLPTNVEKSICYGKIGLLTEAQKKKLLHSDHFNYDLRDDYRGEVKLMQERRENLNHYLEDNSFDMRSLGYIFGNHTLQEAKDWCFQEYRKQIISSEIGRGSNFRRFYDYLFRNEWYLNIVIYENLFDLIPTSSVNFSNFIDSLYLAVQNKEISSRCFERIKREYLTKVEKDDLVDNDVAVLEALLLIQMEEKDDEP